MTKTYLPFYGETNLARPDCLRDFDYQSARLNKVICGADELFVGMGNWSSDGELSFYDC